MRRILCAAVAAGLLGGCYGRAHLDDAYGQRTRAGFAAQRVGGEPRASRTGLDSEEAALIHQQYRESLAPKGRPQETPASRVLLVPEPTGRAPAR